MLISDQPQGCGNLIAKLTKDINAFAKVKNTRPIFEIQKMR